MEAREVKPPTALASLENDTGENSSSRTIFARPRMRNDERWGVYGFGQSRRSHSDVSPCAKHPLPLGQQAMAMHLSRCDEHHVMKAITGVPSMATGKEFTPRERRLRRRQGEFCRRRLR
jgi:hypothetical protein